MLTQVAVGVLVHQSSYSRTTPLSCKPDDPRIGPSAAFGKDWLPGVYEWQLQRLAQKEASATGRPPSDS